MGESEMRRSIRTLFVCLLVALVVYQPALACHSCGGWGGGYAPTYYSYGPVAYSGGCSGWNGCGYETVVYDSGSSSCGSCGSSSSSSCSSCGGRESATMERAPAAPTDSME